MEVLFVEFHYLSSYGWLHSQMSKHLARYDDPLSNPRRILETSTRIRQAYTFMHSNNKAKDMKVLISEYDTYLYYLAVQSLSKPNIKVENVNNRLMLDISYHMV